MARRISAPPEDFSSIAEQLRAAGDRVAIVTQSSKKNYAEALSRALATKIANLLRPNFEGIVPDVLGQQQESPARSSRGVKKLDVNYSKPELGLGLGVSIKTINFPDPKSKRYTKNFTRVDNELRAEAADYHERQPWAVLIALVFLPVDSVEDGGSKTPSSFGSAAQYFKNRAGRRNPRDPELLFEAVFIGLYDPTKANFGKTVFFDVEQNPPKRGLPKSTIDFAELRDAITEIYDLRNNPTKSWAEEGD